MKASCTQPEQGRRNTSSFSLFEGLTLHFVNNGKFESNDGNLLQIPFLFIFCTGGAGGGGKVYIIL